MMGKQKTRHSW